MIKSTHHDRINTFNISKLNFSHKFWQGFGDGSISLVRQKNNPLSSPSCSSPSPSPSMSPTQAFTLNQISEPAPHVTLCSYPALSHLQQQQKQQTSTAMTTMPASTDMVMIKTWKLTVSKEKILNYNSGRHILWKKTIFEACLKIISLYFFMNKSKQNVLNYI